jgi:hypothetical protein
MAAHTPKQQVMLSVLVIGIGNVAELLGSLRKINEDVVNLLGISGSNHLYHSIWAVILIGYVLATTSAYPKFAALKTTGRKALLGGGLLVGAMSGYAANYVVLPKPPVPLLEGRIGPWRERILQAQDLSTRGFRGQLSDPSSFPQVMSTAQGLTAILSSEPSASEVEPVKAALKYMEKARNRSGEEGWGYTDTSKPTITEIAAWVTTAEVLSVRANIWSDQELQTVLPEVVANVRLLLSRQDTSGGWSQLAPPMSPSTRTYPTAMSLWALFEALQTPAVRTQLEQAGLTAEISRRIEDGTNWLFVHYDEKIWWVPNPNRLKQVVRFPGLTAQVLHVLSRGEDVADLKDDKRYLAAKRAFLSADDLTRRSIYDNEHLPDDDLYPAPANSPVEGMTFLWYPWSAAEYASLASDMTLGSEDRKLARNRLSELLSKYGDLDLVESGGTYQLAENLHCLTYALRQIERDGQSK